jgi:hypothetical protein
MATSITESIAIYLNAWNMSLSFEILFAASSPFMGSYFVSRGIHFMTE